MLFKGVVTLETQRRDNNAKARALVLQLSDMLGALLQLRDVKDPELKTDNGESVRGRVQALMGRVEQEIEEVGNLIDTHHKHSATCAYS